MKRLLVIVAIFNAFLAGAQNNTPIGTWRMHLPYNSVRQIIEVPSDQYLYVLAEMGIYTLDLKSGVIERLTKVEGFSESAVDAMAYSADFNTLVIGYENTNIDLLKDDRIINLPGILRSNIVGQKRIRSVSISGKFAYLATTFGVVVIDLEREEIVDDYQNLGSTGDMLAVESVAVFRDSLFIATKEGIKYAPAFDDQVNLKNYTSWITLNTLDSALWLTPYNDALYFTHDSILYRYTGTTAIVEDEGYHYRSLTVSYDQLIMTRDMGIAVIDVNGTITERGEPFMSYATMDFQDNIWFGGFYRGLIKKTPGDQLSYTTPQGPFGPTSFEMEGQGKMMWVTSGGVTTAFGPTYNGYGFYRYEDGKWTNRRADDPDVGDMTDFTAIEIDERTGEVWLASFTHGLIRLNNGQFVDRYDHNNSVLQLAPGDFPVVLGLAMDRNGDLWMSNYETDRALVVRRSDGTWEDFNVGTRRLGEMVVDEYGQLWSSIPRNSSSGIMVSSEEDGIFRTRIFTTGKENGGLPNNNVRALCLDKDGEIWVGTEGGLAIFYNPQLAFVGGVNADAQQIIIDDGQDIGYLLGTEVINDIKIDGANRKWIATNNGAWLVKEDGSEVVMHLTTKNSPLPSDLINTIGIVPETGEVFFGTSSGVASFRNDATEAGDFHSVTLVYPNPVHSDYDGLITITGVPEDATVKIVDVAGRVVYEMVATGGTAVWDGRNFNGERPHTGVYLIFTANKDDEDALVSKLLLVR